MTDCPVRVLIVDDSRTAREVLRAIFERPPEFTVAGLAGTGQEAVESACALRPDLILLDLMLPDMDGLEVARAIMARAPTRIIVVSRVLDRDAAHTSFKALEAGALEAVHKGSLIIGESRNALAASLLDKARALTRLNPLQAGGRLHPVHTETVPRPVRLVVVGSSTGGPTVLRHLLAGLPGDFPAPMVVVQHLTPGFEQGMCDWLSTATELPVSVATLGQRLRPGQVVLAPHGRDLTVSASGVVNLAKCQPGAVVCPCADVTLEAAAHTYRSALVGVLLSGLGHDGVRGLAAVRAQGGIALVQDPTSCMAPSMPASALQAAVVDAVLTPTQLADALCRLCLPAKELEWA